MRKALHQKQRDKERPLRKGLERRVVERRGGGGEGCGEEELSRGGFRGTLGILYRVEPAYTHRGKHGREREESMRKWEGEECDTGRDLTLEERDY